YSKVIAIIPSTTTSLSSLIRECLLYYYYRFVELSYQPSFPTRRSSDLLEPRVSCRTAYAPQRRGRPAEAHPHPPARSGCRRIGRSEEHTSELQSRENLVCRLLLEIKNIKRMIS